MSQSQRILISSLNWLGDACMSMPALQCLRTAYPDTHITLLSKPGLIPLWNMHPAVDATIALDSSPAGMMRAVSHIRSLHFEHAAIFPNSWRSALPPFLAGIPKRTGQCGHHRGLLINDPVELSAKATKDHQQWEYIEILRLDTPAILPAPSLQIPSDTVDKVGKVLQNREDTKWIGMLPGAARGPSKQWPENSFIEAAKLINSSCNTRTLVLGVASEADLCSRIADSIGPSAMSLAGRTTLPELAAALARCAVVLCNDSGGMHLTAAVGTPVVAMYGITDPSKTGPLGKGHKLIQADGVTQSRDVPRDSHEARNALLSIRPERVATAALEIIDNAQDKIS